MKNILFPLILLLSFVQASAQIESVAEMRNGYIIPNRGVLRILVVFAEVDYGDQSCGPDLFTANNGNKWGVDKKGKTLVPDDADWLFDQEKRNDGKYEGYVTQFFHEASLGQYIVLGDYYPDVVKVHCDNMSTSPYTHYTAIRDEVNKLPDATLTTKHGLKLKDFDLFDWNQNAFGHNKNIAKGEAKKIDVLLIIWRNNIFLDRLVNNTAISCNAGFGLTQLTVKGAFKDMNGVQSVASYNGCVSAKGAALATVGEYFHGLFGGNHWHSAGGAGRYTFMTFPFSYSITGQQGIRTCGYDRWVMDWRGYQDDERKQYRRENIAALDSNRQHIVSDLDSENLDELEYNFILRDFMSYGDVVRIKLPYLRSNDSSVKNQYLWLENHQLVTRFDKNKFEDQDCTEPMSPGIYAYVQVGKDELSSPKMYTSNLSHTNGIGSWIMPITAEGNFDFHYEDELKTTQGDCVWGNHSLPINKSDRRTKANPFTGFSDVFSLVNSTQDLILQPSKSDCKKDCWQAGISEVNSNGKLVHNLNAYGDSQDAFQSGSTMSISTNPAPVPVYTYTSNPYPKSYPGKLNSYENRKIWLNGISIEVLDQIRNSHVKANDLLVRVKFDHYIISKATRWCGDIELSANIKDPLLPSLIINKGVQLLVDRGESPTQHIAVGPGKAGKWHFTQESKLNLRPSSFMLLKEGSSLVLNANSKLQIQSGAKFHTESGAQINIESKSKIVVAKGADIHLAKGTRIDLSTNSTITVHDAHHQKLFADILGSSERVRLVNETTDGKEAD